MTDTLMAAVTPHGSESLRFGGDEPLAERIMQRPTLGTQMPGGFADGSFVVARPDSISAIDAPRFEYAPGTFYGDAGRIAYEGRIIGIPQIGSEEIELRMQGYSAHLGDDETLRAHFLDRDLANWTTLPRARKNALGDAFTLDEFTPTADAGGATALFVSIDSVGAGLTAVAEAWYDGGWDEALDAALYDAKQGANVTSGFGARIYGADSEALAGLEGPVADVISLGGAQTYAYQTGNVFTSPHRYLLAQFISGASPGVGAFAFGFGHVLIVGNTGLTLRGTAPDQGYYASDIIGYVLAQAAPLLNFTAGDSIEDGTFVIPHLLYKEGTTALQVIEDVTALGGGASLVNDWGVYENREFFWKTPGTYGTTWRIRKDEAADPSTEGPDVRARANGALVTYTDAAGVQWTAGPPGSGADTESADLEDTSDENPCNLAGIRRHIKVNAGLTVADGAVLIGRLALLEANADKRKGRFTHTGEIRDEAGNIAPPWMVRAGDRVVIEDGDDTTEQRIISTSYDDESNTVSGDIGGTPDRLDALLGRLAVVDTAAGF